MPKRIVTQRGAGSAPRVPISQKDIERTLLSVKERKKEILLKLMRQNANKNNWSAEELESRRQKLNATFI
jgi:hypothetical protein